MSIAKVVELSCTSKKSFEDAIQKGIARASETLHGIQGAWVQDQKVTVDAGKVTEYRVNLKVTFVLRGKGDTPPPFRREDERLAGTATSTEFAIAAASSAAVTMLGAPALIVFTKSGFSARVVASHRPGVPILVLTDSPRTFRQLALVWGVIPELVPHCSSYDEMARLALSAVQRRELARPGDRVVVTAGVPIDVPGTTNVLKVETV